MLDGGSQLVYISRVGDRDFKIWALLVGLEAEQAFPKDHLHGVNRWLVLGELCLKICFVPVDILPLEIDWGSNVKIMKKVGHMQEDRVASLQHIVRRVIVWKGVGRSPLIHQTS